MRWIPNCLDETFGEGYPRRCHTTTLKNIQFTFTSEQEGFAVNPDRGHWRKLRLAEVN